MKISIFGWEANWTRPPPATPLRSFPLAHAVISPAIPHMFEPSTAPGTNGSRSISCLARGSSSARHPSWHRIQPWTTTASISDCRNGSELLPCHRIQPSRVRTFVSPGVILCCFSRRCYFAPSLGDEARNITVLNSDFPVFSGSLILSFSPGKASSDTEFSVTDWEGWFCTPKANLRLSKSQKMSPMFPVPSHPFVSTFC